jgi:hypothetical protein
VQGFTGIVSDRVIGDRVGVDANTFRWQSIDREIGGEMQPNIPEVTVLRQKADAADSAKGPKESSL